MKYDYHTKFWHAGTVAGLFGQAHFPDGHCHVAIGLAINDLRPYPSMMTKISYSGYRFPPEIIQQAIWLYVRFTLSFRDVEDLLA